MAFVTIGKWIYDYLANDTDVAALVGTRIYPERAEPNATLPYLIYSIRNTEPSPTKDGSSTLDTFDVQISTFADSYSSCDAVSNLVRQKITYKELNAQGVNVQHASFTDSDDNFDQDRNQRGVYIRHQTFDIRVVQTQTSPDCIMVFDTRIQGGASSATNNLKLHFDGSSNDCVVDWGDGTTQTIIGAGERNHQYTTPGIYKVTFSGTRVSLKIDASMAGASQGRRDAFKLLEIQNWGIFVFHTDSIFEGCKNMIITATDIPTITTSTFANMFAWCFKMTAPSTMNQWDISGVVSLSSCFYFCKVFNTYINDWDTSNIVNFQSMFNQAGAYNQNLNSWDVSNATNFKYMFNYAATFDGDISSWQFKTDGTVDFTYMFGNASNFNQNVSNWNTERVINMQQTFYAAYSFSQNLNSWNLSNVYSVYRMLYALDQYDQPMNNWDISNITDFRDFMRNSDGYSTANYDALLISWGAQDVSLNESINFGSSQYTAGGAAEAARTFLITNKGWTITDGGAA